MKKTLLALTAILLVIAGKSQVILYASPSVELTKFSANLDNSKVTLNWAITSNETTDRFEVERSNDGLKFTTAALVFTSEKSNAASYSFHENISFNGRVYYRLKIYDTNQSVSYSKMLQFREVPNSLMAVR